MDTMTQFFSRKPALMQENFIGRTSDLRWIASKLNTDSPQNINIVGEPRIGKTSLLYQAYQEQRLGHDSSGIMPVWIAPGEFTQPNSSLFWWSLLISLSEITGKAAPSLSQESEPQSLFNALVFLLEQIIEEGIAQQVFFFIDDFDLLAPPVLGADDLNWLRALTQRDRLLAHVAFVIASTDALQKICSSMQEISPFHNIFIQRRLGLLRLPEAESLVESAARAAGDVTDAPVSLTKPFIHFLIEEAGRHPDLLRIISEYFFTHTNVEYADRRYDLVRADFRYDDHVQWLFQTLFNRRTQEEKEALLALAGERSFDDIVLLNHLAYRLGLLEKRKDGSFRLFSAAFAAWLGRLQAQRSPKVESLAVTKLGDAAIPSLIYDASLRQIVFADGSSPVQLTRVENRLLSYLVDHVGTVCSQEDILANVWGPGRNKSVVEKTINRLRSKIEPDPSRPQYIISVWGQGYILKNAVRA